MGVKFQDSSTLAQNVQKKKAKTLTFVRKKPNDSQIAFLPKPW